MKLRNATFNDTDELATLTVEITAREAALLYAFVGHTSPASVTAATDLEWGNTIYDVAEDLSSIGNRFFDGGWADVLRADLGFKVRA